MKNFIQNQLKYKTDKRLNIDSKIINCYKEKKRAKNTTHTFSI